MSDWYMSDVNWFTREAECQILASIDESEPYEVDQTAILYDEKIKKFILLTASGCSCWDGDAYEEQFDSFEELSDSLMGTGEGREYNPSLVGAAQLIAEALPLANKIDQQFKPYL